MLSKLKKLQSKKSTTKSSSKKSKSKGKKGLSYVPKNIKAMEKVQNIEAVVRSQLERFLEKDFSSVDKLLIKKDYPTDNIEETWEGLSKNTKLEYAFKSLGKKVSEVNYACNQILKYPYVSKVNFIKYYLDQNLDFTKAFKDWEKTQEDEEEEDIVEIESEDPLAIRVREIKDTLLEKLKEYASEHGVKIKNKKFTEGLHRLETKLKDQGITKDDIFKEVVKDELETLIMYGVKPELNIAFISERLARIEHDSDVKAPKKYRKVSTEKKDISRITSPIPRVSASMSKRKLREILEKYQKEIFSPEKARELASRLDYYVDTLHNRFKYMTPDETSDFWENLYVVHYLTGDSIDNLLNMDIQELKEKRELFNQDNIDYVKKRLINNILSSIYNLQKRRGISKEDKNYNKKLKEELKLRVDKIQNMSDRSIYIIDEILRREDIVNNYGYSNEKVLLLIDYSQEELENIFKEYSEFELHDRENIMYSIIDMYQKARPVLLQNSSDVNLGDKFKLIVETTDTMPIAYLYNLSELQLLEHYYTLQRKLGLRNINYARMTRYQNIDCINKQKDSSWYTEGKIMDTLLKSSQNISKFIKIPKDTINKPKKYYQCNVNFYLLQCSINSHKNYFDYKEKELICYDDNDNEYRFKIILVIKPYSVSYFEKNVKSLNENSIKMKVKSYTSFKPYFVLFDGELYDKKIEYFNVTREKDEEKIKEILTSKISQNKYAYDVAKNTLSDYLYSISSIEKYDRSSSFVNDVLKNIIENLKSDQLDYEPSVSQVYKAISSICAVLMLPEANNLRDRIKNGDYTPYAISTISSYDELYKIFPELIQLEKDDGDIDQYITYLNKLSDSVFNLMRDKLLPKDYTKRKSFIALSNVEEPLVQPTLYKVFDKKRLLSNLSTFEDYEDKENLEKLKKKLKKMIKSSESDDVVMEAIRGYDQSKELMKLYLKISKYMFRQRKIKCLNRDDYKDVNINEIITYKDGSEKYCFTIKQLRKMINSDNPINPKTGRVLNPKFIEMFTQIFGLEEKKEDVKISEVKKESEIILKNLWFDVYESIYEKPYNKRKVKDVTEQEDIPIEEEKRPKKKRKDSETTSKKSSKKSKGDTIETNTSSKPSVETEDNSTSSKPSIETESKEEKSPSKKEKKSKKSSKSSKFRVGEEDKSNTTCFYCKSELKDIFKTVMYNNDNINIVEFCCLKCMEGQEFPAYRKSKKS